MPRQSKKSKPAEEAVQERPSLTELSVDLGREDLNQLVAKVNEVIRFLNK
jgi:hypothetical protein